MHTSVYWNMECGCHSFALIDCQCDIHLVALKCIWYSHSLVKSAQLKQVQKERGFAEGRRGKHLWNVSALTHTEFLCTFQISPSNFLVRIKIIILCFAIPFMFYWWLLIKLNCITQRAMQSKRFSLLTFYCWRGQLAGCLNYAIDPKGQKSCWKCRKRSFQ